MLLTANLKHVPPRPCHKFRPRRDRTGLIVHRADHFQELTGTAKISSRCLWRTSASPRRSWFPNGAGDVQKNRRVGRPKNTRRLFPVGTDRDRVSQAGGPLTTMPTRRTSMLEMTRADHGGQRTRLARHSARAAVSAAGRRSSSDDPTGIHLPHERALTKAATQPAITADVAAVAPWPPTVAGHPAVVPLADHVECRPARRS